MIKVQIPTKDNVDLKNYLDSVSRKRTIITTDFLIETFKSFFPYTVSFAKFEKIIDQYDQEEFAKYIVYDKMLKYLYIYGITQETLREDKPKKEILDLFFKEVRQGIKEDERILTNKLEVNLKALDILELNPSSPLYHKRNNMSLIYSDILEALDIIEEDIASKFNSNRATLEEFPLGQDNVSSGNVSLKDYLQLFNKSLLQNLTCFNHYINLMVKENMEDDTSNLFIVSDEIEANKIINKTKGDITFLVLNSKAYFNIEDITKIETKYSVLEYYLEYKGKPKEVGVDKNNNILIKDFLENLGLYYAELKFIAYHIKR